MNNQQSGQRTTGKTQYNQAPGTIFNHGDLRMASDVLVIARGSDGQPQIWASGDQSQAKRLFDEGFKLLGKQAEPVG